MRQEASESTETHEYGSMSIEYVNDHFDNNLNEQHLDDEFLEEDPNDFNEENRMEGCKRTTED